MSKRRCDSKASVKLEVGAGIEPAMAWCKHATLTWLGYPTSGHIYPDLSQTYSKCDKESPTEMVRLWKTSISCGSWLIGKQAGKRNYSPMISLYRCLTHLGVRSDSIKPLWARRKRLADAVARGIAVPFFTAVSISSMVVTLEYT